MNTSRLNKRRKTRTRNLLTLLLVIIILLGVPYSILKYQAGKSGMTTREVLQRKMLRNENQETANSQSKPIEEGEKKDFLVRRDIGFEYTDKPMISHIAVDDLDEDGLLDVRVDADAVSADQAGPEIQEVPLRTGGFEHLFRVDTQALENQR